MICVYNKNNTEFTKNGDAVLMPLSATLEVTKNGPWQLKLSHPYDPEGRYKLLVEGNIIRADITCIRELETIRQLFRIYYFMRDTSAVEVIAFPVAMEANFDAPIDNIVIENKTGIEAMAALQNKIGSGKYTLQTDISRTGSTSLANTNIHTAIAGSGENSFLKVWGGELIYDNYKFKVRNRVGDNTAADHKIQYGNNMSNIEYKKDDSGVTTRIYPISQDGIRLNGAGYVDSPDHFSDYPVAHCKHMTAPYTLVDTNPTSPTSTAAKTRQAVAAVTAQAQTDINTGVANATGAGIPPEYIKSIRQNITDAVKTAALSAVYSSSLYAALGAAIEAGAAGLAELEQPEWGWMGSDETGWKYGNADSYARNEYIKIGKKWSYFGDDGNWQEPRDDSAAWDWHQESGTLKRYGNFEKYYAHNEYIYITENGTLKEYWFNEQGWYESDESGDSDWAWHGSGTAEDPWWFGEEGASASDTRKYAHDCWLFIDGTLYFFDSHGYYDGSTKFENYQWDWVESDERFWFGNDEDHSFAAVYLTSQWAKINGAWYYFDANGYVETTNDSIERAVAFFTAAITGTTSTVNSWRDQLYTLLYNNMTAWALRKYSQERVDLPVITISVFTVDLSKTTEYKGFEHLQTIKLGDSVECTDAVHGISTINRVVGIVYDIIKDYNEEVVIGSAAATVGQILGSGSGQAVAGGFDTSALEAQISATQTSLGTLQRTKQNKLTAGDNITIENDVISAAGGGGLQYWTETQKKFYNTGKIEGISGNTNFIKTTANEVGTWQNGQGWQRCIVTRVTGTPRKAVMGYSQDTTGHPIIVVAALTPLDFEWGFSNNTLYPPYDVQTWESKETYPVSQESSSFGYNTGSCQYDGATWYVLLIDTTTWSGGTALSASEGLTGFNKSRENDPEAMGLALLEAAQAKSTTTVTMEIATEGDIVKYYTDEKTIIDIDADGNATVNEITTAAGSLTSQMAAKQNKLTAGDNITIDGDTISSTDTKYNNFTGATAQEAGTAGLVPAPETTESDKFLKGDGTWATPSGGGGSANIVELTQAEYDALPSSKLSDDTLYMVYFDGGQTLDPNYNYYKYGANDEIVVRVYHEGQADQEIRWYFHEYTQEAALIPIPAELGSYWSGANTARAYTANTSTIYGWIAVTDYLGGRMGIYSTNWGQYLTGPIDAMIVIGGGAEQSTTYSDPYVYIQDSPPFTKIYYNTHEFTHKVTANPTGAATETLEKIEVDGVIYETGGRVSYGTAAPTGSGNNGDLFILLDSNNNKIGEYLFITNAWAQIE